MHKYKNTNISDLYEAFDREDIKNLTVEEDVLSLNGKNFSTKGVPIEDCIPKRITDSSFLGYSQEYTIRGFSIRGTASDPAPKNKRPIGILLKTLSVGEYHIYKENGITYIKDVKTNEVSPLSPKYNPDYLHFELQGGGGGGGGGFIGGMGGSGGAYVFASVKVIGTIRIIVGDRGIAPDADHAYGQSGQHTLLYVTIDGKLVTLQATGGYGGENEVNAWNKEVPPQINLNGISEGDNIKILKSNNGGQGGHRDNPGGGTFGPFSCIFNCPEQNFITRGGIPGGGIDNDFANGGGGGSSVMGKGGQGHKYSRGGDAEGIGAGGAGGSYQVGKRNRGGHGAAGVCYIYY